MNALLSKFAAITACAALITACASTEEKLADPSVKPKTTLATVALIMGEPNFSVDGSYQELEEGLYTKPELKPGKKIFAPIQDIITLLGGEYHLNAAARSASYSLNGVALQVTAGSTTALVNGVPKTLDLSPELRESSMWVPLASVFEQWGGYNKWEEARQRFSTTLILPVSPKTEDFARGGKVTEATLTNQLPSFYGSEQGRKLADVVLAYQNKDGGWPKLDRDVNMLVPINTQHLTGTKAKSTIDNDSTMKQIRVLARAYTAFKDTQYLEGFNRGMDYIFAAQLSNGGWQQFWPDPIGYKKRITFNDDAIANVLEVMRDITIPTPEFTFVDALRKKRANEALQHGIDLILKTQLVVRGKKTGWSAQYDENTLAPAMGRAFELASISGHESVNVVKFLMSLNSPSPAVIQAVQDAVTWFDSAKMPGQKRVKKEDRTLEMGFDYVLVKDPNAPPIWARFYDLETGEPLFTSRDSIKRSDFSDVSYERRVKYNWFSEYPRELLGLDYPAWQEKWAPKRDVLAR